jgi:hypothetical protein
MFDGVSGVLDRVAPVVDAHAGGVTAFVVLQSDVPGAVGGTRVRGELLLGGDNAEAVYVVPRTYLAFDFSGPVLHTEQGTRAVTVVRDTGHDVYVRGEGLSDGMTLVR